MKKILLILLLTFCINANALVTKSTDAYSNEFYYTSFPMPGAKWKTKIAVKRWGASQWIVAVPFYYYGNSINADILKLRNYLTTNGISYRDGVCVTFPYTTPCLY